MEISEHLAQAASGASCSNVAAATSAAASSAGASPAARSPPPQLDVQNKSLRWPNIRTEYVLILFLLKPLG